MPVPGATPATAVGSTSADIQPATVTLPPPLGVRAQSELTAKMTRDEAEAASLTCGSGSSLTQGLTLLGSLSTWALASARSYESAGRDRSAGHG